MTKPPFRIHFRQGDFELDVEGDRQFVESYVAAFVAGAPIEVPGPTPGRREAKRPGAPGKRPAEKAEAAPSIDGEALKAFTKVRRPKSAKERYLVYLGFLKAQGIPAASDREMRACFVAEGRKVPASGRQNFSILRKEGLVKPGPKRGLWTLTPEGEARLAPSRAKVGTGSKAAPAAKAAKTASRAGRSKAKPAKKAGGKAVAKAVAKKAKPAKAAPAKVVRPKAAKAKGGRKGKSANGPAAREAKPRATKQPRPKGAQPKHGPEVNPNELILPDAMPD